MLVFSEKITVSQILKFQQQIIEAFLNSTDMSEENKESPIVPVSMDSWVEWFRSVAPHIHSIRGKTIVIDLAGETILQEHFSSLIADISMISAIGARIVLVYGVRPQVEELMSLKAIESQYVNGILGWARAPRVRWGASKKPPAKRAWILKQLSLRAYRTRRWLTANVASSAATS